MNAPSIAPAIFSHFAAPCGFIVLSFMMKSQSTARASIAAEREEDWGVGATTMLPKLYHASALDVCRAVALTTV